ncbi:hypothetical protein VAE142_931039 [Vibrio aestuarianus]|nr:hypothetical protein VAE142_931039 [Vibrio aestuarianus]
MADLDDETIEKLVLERSPVSKAPKDYLLYLKEYMLFGDTFNNLEVELTNVGLLPPAQTKIRYCKFCFLDQMRSFGFTWFLLDRLFDIECYHHHILLSHVHTARTECCGMQLSFHQNFYSVLNGSCRGCNQNRWSFAQPIKIQGVHYNYLDTYQDEIHRKIPLGY